MGLLEVVLIILGLAIFILSFAIPERKEKISSKNIEIAEEVIRQMVDDQMEHVSELVEETIEEKQETYYERANRRLERLSNEKILAVGEYSDTVLHDIKKNHDEVVFMYDMLNNKHQSLNEFVTKIEQAKIDSEDLVKKYQDLHEQPVSNKPVRQNLEKEVARKDILSEEEEVLEESFLPLTPKVVRMKPERKEVKATNTSSKNVAIQFSKNNSMGANSNERILELHKEGKSNMVIAKELGLGIGEVKLVIDLFKGM